MIIIHHGNGVEAGLAEVLEDKTLVAPPFKDLKVKEVKHLVRMFSQVYPHKNPTLLAGPLDDADPSTLDILLKRIEEPINQAPLLILWAYDLGSVPKTIRSRCGEKFYYAPSFYNEFKEASEALYEHFTSKDELGVVQTLKMISKGQERAFLNSYIQVLEEKEAWGLYDSRLKKMLNSTKTNKTCLVGYFLGEC